MLVLLADKFPAQGQAALAELGLDIVSRPTLTADEIPAALAETDAAILVVRSTKVTSEAFSRGTSLSLVVRAGAGVNTIDLEAASARGVYVANCPGKNAVAVAELTMGLILALDRNIADAHAQMKAGHWNKKRFSKARGLYGRSLALVGFGAIAREVATRASAFGMEVSTFDPMLTADAAENAGVHLVASIPDLVANADVVSVHVPYGKSTHHLINDDVLAAMKQGAILVHAARGGVVDDAALARAVQSGRIRAGLDVLEDEPSGGETDFDHPLMKLEGVCATPHIGASTEQAQSAIADEVIRIVSGYLRGGAVANAVNVQVNRGPKITVILRHLDRVGVLAAILQELRAENLNVQEMSNVIFAGNQAASATITLAAPPSAALLKRIRSRDDVLSFALQANE